MATPNPDIIYRSGSANPLTFDQLDGNFALLSQSIASVSSPFPFTGTARITGSLLISGSIIPNTNGVSSTSSFNLGSPTAAWKDIYVSNGTINFLDASGTIVQTMGTGNNQLTGDTTITGKLNQGSGNSTVGEYSHAEGYTSISNGPYSHAEGGGGLYEGGRANGTGSHAEGAESVASGSYSHAEGFKGQALGYASHAEGRETIASGSYSHTEGHNTITSASYAHAEGFNSKAEAIYSHVEGFSNTTSGPYSHAEGRTTKTFGTSSHAEGFNTQAIGNYSHAEGHYAITSASYAHAEGGFTSASANWSHAEGYFTRAEGVYSHTEGLYTTASGEASHAEGVYSTALGYSSHAEGNTCFSGIYAWNTTGTSAGNIQLPTSFGDLTSYFPVSTSILLQSGGTIYQYIVSQSSYAASVTSIQLTNTSVNYGASTPIALYTPTNFSITPLPYQDKVLGGEAAHSEGYGNVSIGSNSHAEGYATTTLGVSSHAEGAGTVAAADYQHVAGRFNVSSSNVNDLFIIGNGIDASNRKNALVVKFSGSIALPTTQSVAPSWTGVDGEIIPATVGGKYLLYMWMAGAWRSGSFV
jgi:hypothetical protein